MLQEAARLPVPVNSNYALFAAGISMPEKPNAVIDRGKGRSSDWQLDVFDLFLWCMRRLWIAGGVQVMPRRGGPRPFDAKLRKQCRDM